MEKGQEKLWGFFSEEALDLCGTHWYSTPEGGEVEVTHIGRSETCSVRFEDLKSLGPVSEYLRPGREIRWLSPNHPDCPVYHYQRIWPE